MTCKNQIAVLLSLVILPVFGLVGCGIGEFGGSTRKIDDEDGLRGKLVITGSSTVAPLIAEVASRFERQHAGVRIDVQTGGSSRGIRDVLNGAADIGMSSRDLKLEERTQADSQTIAWDGVAFVVHQDNPVDRLSEQQLRDIYLGRLSNWSQVGGKEGKIIVSNRANGRSELDLVCDFLSLESGEIQADVVDGETQQSLKTVITNKNAITYTSVGAAQDASERGEPLKLLPLQGIVASSKAIQSGKFPLARPLVLVLKKSPEHDSEKTDLIAAFVKFADSTKVQDVALGLGFVASDSPKR